MSMISRWTGRRSNGGGLEHRRRDFEEPTEMMTEMYRPLLAMQHRLNRVFDDFFEDFPSTSMTLSSPSVMGSMMNFNPRMDVSETSEKFCITADVPGMTESDIEITVSENSLIITGERGQNQEQEDENFFRRERSYGMFRRQIPLPETVERDKISAHFKNGVLTVDVPKNAEAKKNWRKVEVKSG